MAKKPKYSILDVLTEQKRAQALAEMTIFSDIVATKFFDDTGITEILQKCPWRGAHFMSAPPSPWMERGK